MKLTMFHVFHPGETATEQMSELSPFERGVLVGVLVGHGSFGGDGRQPQVALRLHVRHEALVQWLAERVPGSRVYGPYQHGDRAYYQWMARGRPLVQELLPVLESEIAADLDGYAAERLAAMTARYATYIARARARS